MYSQALKILPAHKNPNCVFQGLFKPLSGFSGSIFTLLLCWYISFFFFFYKTWIFQSGALSSLSRKFPFPVPEELGGAKWGNKIEMQQSFLAPSDSVFFHKMISLIGVKGCFFLRIWDIRPRQVTTRCIPFTAGVTEQLEFLSCHSLRADELVIKNGSEPSDLPTVLPC